MADVRPFTGLRYNHQIVGELTDIVCPPFDTIPPDLQGALYQRNPYNVVRLEAGERLPSDTPQDNRYTRAAALFSDWLEGRVLVQDEEPAFYLVRHTFKLQGIERTRLEIMARVRLEEYERRVVLPHEYTRDEDKRDRLALMEACHANFSPIMCLYRDEDGTLSTVLSHTIDEPPLWDFSDAGSQDYRVWKIDDPGLNTEIMKAMSAKPLYIADGHHRYETALTYRDLMLSGRGGIHRGDEGFNFVMMGLIEFDDPGLMVLPYHRLIGGLDATTLARVIDGLGEFFNFEPFSDGEQSGLEGLLEEIELRGRSGLVIGLVDFMGQGFQVLTRKPGIELDAWGPIAQSEAWILEEQVLKPILGDSVAGHLIYIHDGDEAEAKVRKGDCQLGFFLKPFPLALFETIMTAGQRLPPKSTFFYPKLPAGLVINQL